MLTHNELRRLLELAAKAVGRRPYYFDGIQCGWHTQQGIIYKWNPEYDDGDSRRLEVALRMKVVQFPMSSEAYVTCGEEVKGFAVPHRGIDAAEATRLAVLRVAAAIGEAMQ